MLEWVVRRAAEAEKLDKLIVATSTDPSDVVIEQWCCQNGVACYRGALDDVLGRFYHAALSQGAGHIVRITADCPLIDPEVVDFVVVEHLRTGADYTSNIEPRTCPDGLDTEVFTFNVLKRLYHDVVDPQEREHVTLHIRNRKNQFNIANTTLDQDLANLRWTVDTEEDFQWAGKILSKMAIGDTDYRQIINITETNQLHRYSLDDNIPSGNDHLQSGQILYERAKSLIPGGTQLLSKRPEMYLPGRWPAYYASARGAWVKDLDGRSYIDMTTNGIGTCVLGAADPVVNAAVNEAVNRGSMSTLNAPEEVELAEILCELHPWASKVRFARTGGESMAVAIRIARAATGKSIVLFCGYHGWTDWYLAANLADSSGLDNLLLPGLLPKGVPTGLEGSAAPFHFNCKSELDDLLRRHENRIAAIVMEPQRYAAPEPGFLEYVRQKANEKSIVLAFDEITSGWRKNIGGVHLSFGVNPDIAVFGKALGNGFAIGAIIGTGEVMEACQETFISSTYWTERVGPVAAIATIRRMQELNSPELLDAAGRKVQEIWRNLSSNCGISIEVGHEDMPPLSHFHFCLDDNDKNRMAKTAWCQVMLDAGVLDNGSFYATCSHSDSLLTQYAERAEGGFKRIAMALENGSCQNLAGELAHTGFQRLN